MGLLPPNRVLLLGLVSFCLLISQTTNAWVIKKLLPIGLHEDCTTNRHCTTPHSYCSIQLIPGHVFQDRYICACKDGYHATDDGRKCVPHHRCSNRKFNHDMTQNDCPSVKQFCREGVCQCRPDYAYTSTGQCIWNSPYAPPNSGWLKVGKSSGGILALAVVVGVMLL